jgi:hypothetical protein
MHTHLIPAVALLVALPSASLAESPSVVRSAKSGAWSDAGTWEGGKLPPPGSRVLIRTGHAVDYDVKVAEPIRAVFVSGTLRFAPDKETLLAVGLLKIQPGDNTAEDGFDCEAHLEAPKPGEPRPALEVGSPNTPIAKSATIRLHYFDGMDKDSCPAIVSCGGKMDFHGTPMSRTWLKLAATAKKGDSTIALTEAPSDWRVGDRVIVVATTRQNKVKKTFTPTLRAGGQTEERTIRLIDGTKVALDKPLEFEHLATEAYQGEVANLSRNVVVESAEPDKSRGHTMYHRNSAGSISYAEFRHLGKEGVLGRYSLHFHLCGDTMRGSSVVGASIWDSVNRWLTIHGTNYVVVRDCVGYKSVGHGFFLEDGTEVFNVLDRNLAVQAYMGKPLPKQVLPFDKNDGSGFWWSNCRNVFVRNVAAECDEYGYFFQAAKTPEFNLTLSIMQPDGTKKPTDIRTLPFIRFEGNEAHTQRRHAFNLGGGVPFGEPNVAGVGPDEKHPFVIRDFKVWDAHWAIHPVSPSLLLDGMQVHNAEYGVWRPVYKNHSYREIKMEQVPEKTQYAFVDGKPDGVFTVADLVNDMPPCTVITYVARKGTSAIVRGTTASAGDLKAVTVNSQAARIVNPKTGEWEAEFANVPPGTWKVKATAEDSVGNVEKRPHSVVVP